MGIETPKFLLAVTKVVASGNAGLPVANASQWKGTLTIDERGNLWTTQDRARHPLTGVSHPAAATQASIVIPAAGAGLSNVLTGITASLSADTTAEAASIELQVLDGAAVIWSTRLGPLAIGGFDRIAVTGLDIAGSANTAMTIRFGAAPAAGNFEEISVQGMKAPVPLP